MQAAIWVVVSVAGKEAPANYVPAAAVIRMERALSGIIGRKGYAGGLISRMLKIGAQPRKALETDKLE